MRRAVLRCASASPNHSKYPRVKKKWTAATLRAAAPATTERSRQSKRGAVFEFLITRLDLAAGQGPEAIDAKLLAAVAPHDGAVDDRASQLGHLDMAVVRVDPLARQITDKAAGKTIARAGGVEDVFEQVARRHEMAVAVE